MIYLYCFVKKSPTTLVDKMLVNKIEREPPLNTCM